jgi:hypothetical protein
MTRSCLLAKATPDPILDVKHTSSLTEKLEGRKISTTHRNATSWVCDWKTKFLKCQALHANIPRGMHPDASRRGLHTPDICSHGEISRPDPNLGENTHWPKPAHRLLDLFSFIPSYSTYIRRVPIGQGSRGWHDDLPPVQGAPTSQPGEQTCPDGHTNTR